MNTFQVDMIPSKRPTEFGYLLINKAATAIAIIDPIATIAKKLHQYTQNENYSLDWILLTHLPADNSLLLQLQSQFACVIASSLTIIEQLPKKLLAYCEPLENHEVVMLGHMQLEAEVSGTLVNYQINDHLFLYDENSIETRVLEKLAKLQNSMSIHLFHFNNQKLNIHHEISPFELKRLVS